MLEQKCSKEGCKQLIYDELNLIKALGEHFLKLIEISLKKKYFTKVQLNSQRSVKLQLNPKN